MRNGAALQSTAYGYGSASRLASVRSGDLSVGYTTLANSPLVSQITFTNAGALRMTTTRQFDYLNRLTSISSAPSGADPVAFSYAYNNANQRTRRTESGESYWIYDYDSLG